MKLFLALVSILLTTTSLCQELKSETRIPATSNNVVKYFVDNSGQLVRICSNGKFYERGGYTFAATPGELLFQSGKNLHLKPLEGALSITGNKLLTIQGDSAFERNDYAVYELAGERLTFIDTLKMRGVEHYARQLPNGNILVDDFSEGYGTYLEMYDPDFKLLSRYVCEKGCSWVSTTASETHLMAAFGDNNNKISVVIFSLDNGKLLKELQVNSELNDEPRIVALKDQFVLFGYSKHEGYDMLGKKLWTSKGINVPGETGVVANDRVVYFVTESELIAVAGPTGAIKWKKSLTELLGTSTNEKSKRIGLAQFVKCKEGVGFLLTIMPTGSFFPFAVKSNAKYVQFNDVGERKYNVLIPGDRKFIHVQETPDGLRITTDTEIFSYK